MRNQFGDAPEEQLTIRDVRELNPDTNRCAVCGHSVIADYRLEVYGLHYEEYIKTCVVGPVCSDWCWIRVGEIL